MHTEEEAKTKWCPLSPTAGPPGPGHGETYCIAADCMLWRWYEEERYLKMKPCPACQLEGGQYFNAVADKLKDDVPNSRETGCEECDWKKQIRIAVPVGYCGLAG